ncbi:MAG: hypothetical protein ACXWV0_09965, partial [Flavisolibacter sp.]
MKIFFFPVVIFLLFSCNENEGKQSLPEQADTTRLLTNGLEVEPDISSADSMEVLYYQHTDEDSLRYSRFYTFT